MDTKTIVICVVALLLGMLIANMLKDVCGCKNVVEGGGPVHAPLKDANGDDCGSGEIPSSYVGKSKTGDFCILCDNALWTFDGKYGHDNRKLYLTKCHAYIDKQKTDCYAKNTEPKNTLKHKYFYREIDTMDPHTFKEKIPGCIRCDSKNPMYAWETGDVSGKCPCEPGTWNSDGGEDGPGLRGDPGNDRAAWRGKDNCIDCKKMRTQHPDRINQIQNCNEKTVK